MSTIKISYFILFLLPVYLIKFFILDLGSINLLDVFLVFYLICWFVLITFKKIKFKKFNSFSKSYWPAILLIISGLTLSFLKNQNPHNWLDQLGIIKSFYLLPIGFGLISAFLVKIKIIKKKLLLLSLFFSTCLIAFISFFYLIFNKLTFDARLSSIFNSPNYLAIHLALGIIILFWIILFSQKIKKNKNKKIIFYLLFLFFSILLIFTKSAGAIIAVLTSFTLLYLIKKSFIKNRAQLISFCLKYLIIFNILFIISFCLISPRIFKKLSYSAFENRGSFDSRLVIYQVSGQILQDNFFLGIGASNFQKIYLNYQKFFPPYPQWAVPHPHNLFLTFWLESGLTGLIGLMLLLLQLSQNIKSNRLKKIDILPFVLIIYFLTHGLIDSTFWKNDLAVIFWLMIFLSFKKPRKNKTKSE